MTTNTNTLAEFSQYHEKAKENEKMGRLDLAVQDMRRALAAIPGQHADLRAKVTGEMTSLLVALNSLRERDGSISQLISEISSNTNDEKTRIAAAEKANFLLGQNSADVAATIDPQKLENLMDALAQLNSDSPLKAKLKREILNLLRQVAGSPTAFRLAQLVTSHSVANLVNDTDTHCAINALPLLADLCVAVSQNSSGFSEFVLNWVSTFLDAVNDALDDVKSTDMRLAALNALIKSTDSSQTSLLVIRHPQLLARVLQTAATTSPESESLRNICPIAISRIMEPILAQKSQSASDLNEAKRALQSHVVGFLESTKSLHKTTGLLALAAVFTASSSLGSHILLAEGVLQEVMEMIEFEVESVKVATVQMLNSACSDQTCRKMISTPESTRVLVNIWQSSKNSDKLRSAAAATLVKIAAAGGSIGDKDLEKSLWGNTRLADGFVMQIKSASSDSASLSSKDPTAFANSIESLAYLTAVRGFVKEIVVNDAALLKTLVGCLKTVNDKSLQYGIVSIFANLTVRRRKLSEEEEQLLKLKEVAGEVVTKMDPLDDDSRVDTRCGKIIAAGVVSPLISVALASTVSLAGVVAQLFLNLCVEKKYRGRIVQDGGIKALTYITTKLNSPVENPSYLVAAQSLAKITITTDPHLAFQPVSRAMDLVRPLIYLLSTDATTLQQFEGLMALTNLASFDDGVRARIAAASSQGVKAMEYLQFSENPLVRRAATEALCNMMLDPTVFESYVSSKSVDDNSGRLKMMIMLCDVEDYETRRAAAGALAVLSSSPNACRLILNDARGIDTVIGLLFHEEEDANPELAHRGVEICKNMAAVGGLIAQRLEAAGVVKLLRRLTLSSVEEIRFGAVEALRNLQSAGVAVLKGVKAAALTPQGITSVTDDESLLRKGPTIVELD